MFAILKGMFDYRKILYSDYFATHSGRGHANDIRSRFETQKRYFKREILPLVTKQTDSKILDLGCGTGSLVSMLQEEGYLSCEGIDVSDGQLKVGEEMGVTGLVKADIREYLSERKEMYDVITGIDIIEHLSKDELVGLLADIQRALKPGGKAIFRTPNADAPLATVFTNADFTHETNLNMSSAIQVMKAVGYRDVKVSAGLVYIENPFKEALRSVLWSVTKLRCRMALFASGRTWDEVIFEPNLLIEVTR